MRVAIALATGQAALCGLIGFVTFGPGLGTPDAGVDSVAGPPAVMPAPGLYLPPAPLPPPPRSSRPDPETTTGTRAETRPRRQQLAETPRVSRAPEIKKSLSATPEDEPDVAQPDGTPVEIPPPAPPEPPQRPGNAPDTVVPVSPGTGDPVEPGTECPAEGAEGRTADDQVVKCVRAEDGTLLWKLA